MAVRDETTGEEILSLDDRSFAHSARNVLKSTISLHDNLSSLPLYYIQFALHRGGRYGCNRKTSNCFVLGEHRMGRPLSITETFYVDDNLAEVRAVLWYCGIVVLWYCGFVVLWFCGFVVLWFCGGGVRLAVCCANFFLFNID